MPLPIQCSQQYWAMQQNSLYYIALYRLIQSSIPLCTQWQWYTGSYKVSCNEWASSITGTVIVFILITVHWIINRCPKVISSHHIIVHIISYMFSLFACRSNFSVCYIARCNQELKGLVVAIEKEYRWHCQNCWISYPRKSSKFSGLLLFLNQEIFCGFPLQGKAGTGTIGEGFQQENHVSEFPCWKPTEDFPCISLGFSCWETQEYWQCEQKYMLPHCLHPSHEKKALDSTLARKATCRRLKKYVMNGIGV